MSTVTITMPAAHEGPHVACQNCGVEVLREHEDTVPLEAQQQIEDLQAQVRLLTQKATAAGQ